MITYQFHPFVGECIFAMLCESYQLIINCMENVDTIQPFHPTFFLCGHKVVLLLVIYQALTRFACLFCSQTEAFDSARAFEICRAPEGSSYIY